MMAIAWNRESNGHWQDLDREVLGCSALILTATGLPLRSSSRQNLYHYRRIPPRLFLLGSTRRDPETSMPRIS